MPKGQHRSNREPKKPKQTKTPVIPPTPFIEMRAKAASLPGKKI